MKRTHDAWCWWNVRMRVAGIPVLGGGGVSWILYPITAPRQAVILWPQYDLYARQAFHDGSYIYPVSPHMYVCNGDADVSLGRVHYVIGPHRTTCAAKSHKSFSAYYRFALIQKQNLVPLVVNLGILVHLRVNKIYSNAYIIKGHYVCNVGYIFYVFQIYTFSF